MEGLLPDAGVREVRLHDVRHTAAPLLPSEGVHPRVVVEVLRPRTGAYDHGHVEPRHAGPGLDAATAPVATTPAPGTTQAALRVEDGLFDRVELRGLEPLPPTLPGRHDRVRSSAQPFRKALEVHLGTTTSECVPPRT